IRCITDFPESEVIKDKDVSLVVFRIFQETLTNIARHSNATNVVIKTYIHSGEFGMEIKDNGIGIADTENNNGSLEIIGMKEKVNLLNGTLKIENLSPGGTLIKVNIPLNYNNN